MMDGISGHGWGGMGLGMGWWWIIGILLIVLVVWLVNRASNQNNAGSSANKSSLDLLKDRYANGEIDKAEFEERKKKTLARIL